MDHAVALLGPTAVGKTAVALDLARRTNAEIISVDSRQIYRGMEIGSAAPTAIEQRQAVHHLVGEVDPLLVMSAGEFGRLARAAGEAIVRGGKSVLLVGGSGLYLRAVLGGLDEELPSHAALRDHLRKQLAEDPEALYRALSRWDPESAERISPRDGQRVSRALELLMLTGRRPSDLRTRGRTVPRPIPTVVLDRDREDMERRIRARVDAMVAAGLAAEVQTLLQRGVGREAPAMKSVGYRETLAHLDGNTDRDTWIAEIVTNTRRYAKRQRTWFRSLPDALWLHIPEIEPPQETASRVQAALSRT